jgi:MinD-like ATPase involved in chromosome partitioning or flagellar assembly
MDQQPARQAIRVVVGAPFKEIVGIHERMSEYADELDVCGVVSSATSVAEQTRILQPDVLVLSENLGVGLADAATRLAATSANTKLVALVSNRDRVPSGAADAVLRLDASAGELRAAIMLAAGRLRGQTAPPAHSRAGTAGAESSHWFWEDPAEPVTPQPEPGADQAALLDQAPAAVPAGAEATSWPPPWLRLASEEAESPESPESPDGPAPPAAAAPSPVPFPTFARPAEASPAEPESAIPDAPVVAEPVIDVPAVAEPEPEALLEQPRKRVRRPGRTKADTVLVFSGKGGVGKSVLATNLAVALSQRGAKVALIDLDLQYGDVGVLLHVESHPTSIESLAQQGEQVDRDYLDEVMAAGPEDVRVLLAPASPEFADLVTAASIRAILRELSRGYDYVIVDSPAHIEERVLEVMEVADQILVVSSFNITSVKDTKVTLKLLQSLGIERDRIAVVLNQTHPKVGFPREEIEKSLRREVLTHLPYDARIDESIDNGRPAVIGEPRSEFSRQLKVVVDFLTPDEAATEDRGADQVRDRASRRRLFGR